MLYRAVLPSARVASRAAFSRATMPVRRGIHIENEVYNVRLLFIGTLYFLSCVSQRSEHSIQLQKQTRLHSRILRSDVNAVHYPVRRCWIPTVSGFIFFFSPRVQAWNLEAKSREEHPHRVFQTLDLRSWLRLTIASHIITYLFHAMRNSIKQKCITM